MYHLFVRFHCLFPPRSEQKKSNTPPIHETTKYKFPTAVIIPSTHPHLLWCIAWSNVNNIRSLANGRTIKRNSKRTRTRLLPSHTILVHSVSVSIYATLGDTHNAYVSRLWTKGIHIADGGRFGCVRLYRLQLPLRAYCGAEDSKEP